MRKPSVRSKPRPGAVLPAVTQQGGVIWAWGTFVGGSVVPQASLWSPCCLFYKAQKGLSTAAATQGAYHFGS